MGDLSEPAGLVSKRLPVPSSSSSEVFAGTEQVTDEIIGQVRPTAVSEESRKAVTCYVQTLLKNQLGCQVIPFGSVPLKTYLPDGDIDLTVFCGFDMEETFAKNVHSVLEREEHNPVAEFVVKDVQYIRAEVKLVKCLIQNIVVDISFNQIGGLCALCFLEEVDRFIGKDHLFKRSIILIKAWCYYESRILGAYHGLISTYALEMLVLYIFHLFHLSLRGPLSVLHKFLDYFSKFDWENYCVSLNGPVLVSSLPEIVAERPDNGGGDLLLSHDFMRECVKKFSVPSKGTETNARIFMRKHLNIVDPLKENNNLGRSVSKGNFFRIGSALAYGARKLGQILLQPQEDIAADVRTYFVNTLARHGQGQRPDVQDIQQMSCCNGFLPDFLLPGVEPSHESRSHKVESFNSNVRSSECRLDSKDTGHVVVDDVQEPGTFSDEASVERQRGIKESIPCSISDDGISSASHLSGDSDKLANGIQDLRITRDADKSSPLPLGYRPYGPYYYFPHRLEHGKTQIGYLYASHETLSFLPDLSGDVDCHLDSLQYGRWWYDSGDTLTNSNQPVHLAPPPLFRRKTQWDAIRQIFRQEVVPHVNVNAVAPRPAFFPSHHPLMAGGPFSIDEIPKTRGTGTFFPITDKVHPAKGRTQRQLKSPRTNGRVSTLVDRNLHAQSPGSQGIWKPRSSDIFVSSPRGKVFKKTNNFVVSSDKAGEFSSLVPPPVKTLLPQTESNRAPDSRSSSGSQSGEPVFVGNLNRFGVQSYHLKDNDDFPPLSS